jgi:hypothetical protein
MDYLEARSSLIATLLCPECGQPVQEHHYAPIIDNSRQYGWSVLDTANLEAQSQALDGLEGHCGRLWAVLEDALEPLEDDFYIRPDDFPSFPDAEVELYALDSPGGLACARLVANLEDYPVLDDEVHSRIETTLLEADAEIQARDFENGLDEWLDENLEDVDYQTFYDLVGFTQDKATELILEAYYDLGQGPDYEGGDVYLPKEALETALETYLRTLPQNPADLAEFEATLAWRVAMSQTPSMFEEA